MAKIASCIVALMIITSCGPLSHAVPSIADFSVLFGSESSKKLIVFVHGFDSDPTRAWTNSAGVSWPDLIRGDQDFRDYTVGTYRYDSPLFSRTSTIEEGADVAKQTQRG